MEDNLYKDELEQFIHDQANHHRMYPSDGLWRNIHNRLHGDRNWPALTIAALTFFAAVVAVGIYFSPGPNIFSVEVAPLAQVTQPKTSSIPLVNAVTNRKKAKTLWKFNQKRLVAAEEIKPSPVAELMQSNVKILASNTPVPNYAGEVKLSTVLSQKEQENTADDVVNIPFETAELIKPYATASTEEKVTEFSLTDHVLSKVVNQKAAVSITSNTSTANKISKERFSYKVYITPSKSFRKLAEDESFQQAKPSNLGLLNYSPDVNKVVRHIPGNGMEAGVGFGYKITHNIKLTSGFQFNVRQYFIEAFASRPEFATIALQTSAGLDSIRTYSTFRNITGNAPTELTNRYYQVSVPIGIELKVLGSKDVSFNVAASVQPTYTINNNAYLLSTDFKNYSESGSMLRNWNLNTNIEAFLSLKAGDYNWIIGPQFRYQQLPTFSSQYPIKEHLMDFGVKIGVTRPIK